MDKMNLTAFGGFPVTGDFLMRFQEAILSGIKGTQPFLRMLPNARSYVILSGCEISVVGSNYTYADGYILLNNDEIYKVEAQNTPQAIPVGGQFYFVVNNTPDPAYIETYEDLSTQNTVMIRNADIGCIVGPPSGLIYDETRLFKNAMQYLLNQSSEDVKSIDTFHQVGTFGEPAFGASFAAPLSGGSLYFKRNNVRMVNINGRFRCTAAGAGTTTVFTIPTAYRSAIATPANTEGVCYLLPPGGLPVAYRVEIDNNTGEVRVIDATVSGTPPVGTYMINLTYQM